MISLAAPVIDDGELDQRNWKPLNHNVLENSHQRDLVSHLDADVVAQKRVDQF
jgi:hypothetical protein